MTIRKTILIMAMTAPLLAGTGYAFSQAQAPASQSGPSAAQESAVATISGTVGDVFGNTFILRAGDQVHLVEAGPTWHRTLAIRSGDTVRVSGRLSADRSISAHTIAIGDGDEIRIREPSGPPPWAGSNRDQRAGDGRLSVQQLREIVEREGFVWDNDWEREDRYYEVEARDANGEEVELKIDFAGNVIEIELDGPRYDQAGLRTIVESAGYEWHGGVDRKGKHFEVNATNPFGESVELHVDFSGEIYKERRRR